MKKKNQKKFPPLPAMPMPVAYPPDEEKQRDGDFPMLLETPVVAGFPSPAEQYLDSPLDLNELLVHQKAATFFVRAAGDSMIEAGIQSGDLLVVDRSLEPEQGSIVIAAVDNEFTVKYFFRESGGRVVLRPANPSYRSIELQGDQELQIFGIVTSVIHQFVH